MTTVSFDFEGREYRFEVASENDLIARAISATSAFYESELLRVLRGLLRPGDLVVDVGANIGNHAVFFSAVCGCSVVAFEPVPEAVALLRSNVILNGVDGRVDIRVHAVGSRAGHARIESTRSANLGATSLIDDPDGELGMLPLDDLNLGRPALLKIDVEGMEMDVLTGARTLIASSRPVVVCEGATREARRAQADFLAGLGYSPVASFGATATVVYLQRTSPRELKLALRISAEHGAETAAALNDLFAEHRATRKTVIKHTGEIAGLGGRMDVFEKEIQDIQALIQGAQGRPELFRELSEKVSAVEARALETVYESIRLMQRLEAHAVEVAQERSRAMAVTGLAERAAAAITRVDAFEARVSEVSDRFSECASRIQFVQASMSSVETGLRDLMAQQDVATRGVIEVQFQRSDAKIRAAESSVARLVERIEVELAEFAGVSSALSRRIDTDQRAINDALGTLAEQLHAKVAGVSEASQSAIVRLESSLAVTEGMVDSLEANLRDDLKNASESISTISARLDQEVSKFNRSNDAVSRRLEEVIAEAHETAQALDASVGSRLSRIEQEQAKTTNRIGRMLEVHREQQQQELAAYSDALGEVRDLHHDSQAELAGKLSRLEATIASEMIALTARSHVEAVRANVKARDLQDRLDAAERQLAKQLDARLDAEQEIYRRIDYVNGRHDALLKGKVFSTLRRIRGLIPSWPQSAFTRKSEDVTRHEAGVAADWPIEVVRHQRLERPKSALLAHTIELGDDPLVTVVMTTFNAAEFVAQAIESVIAQDFLRWELVIVDDKSEDSTIEILESFSRRDRRIRYLTSSVNRGTYWAKNRGILASTGDLVTFMDSDDVIDPTRLRKQVGLIRGKRGAIGSTCNYVRENLAGEVVLNRGLAERVALISLMVKRQVFHDVGMFDTVRTSADDEMVERIKLAYGRAALPNVAEPLYRALLRESSLSTEAGNSNDLAATDATGFLSAARLHFARSYSAWHSSVQADGRVPYVPFPSTRRPFPVHGKLRVQDDRFFDQPVMAFMATFPARIEHLKRSVASLVDQVDHLYVYLNNYAEIPDFLRDSRITALPAAGRADLRDNGKFFHMASAPEGYFLTVDDDIEYPRDYAERLVEAIEFHDRSAVVGVHGVILADPLDRYFSAGRTVFSFKHARASFDQVHLLGTGTTGFHSSCIRPNLSMFPSTGMADVWMAIQANMRDVKMFSIPRGPGWLTPITFHGHKEETLFDEFRSNDTMQTEALRAAGSWPKLI